MELGWGWGEGWWVGIIWSSGWLVEGWLVGVERGWNMVELVGVRLGLGVGRGGGWELAGVLGGVEGWKRGGTWWIWLGLGWGWGVVKRVGWVGWVGWVWVAGYGAP